MVAKSNSCCSLTNLIFDWYKLIEYELIRLLIKEKPLKYQGFYNCFFIIRILSMLDF